MDYYGLTRRFTVFLCLVLACSTARAITSVNNGTETIKRDVAQRRDHSFNIDGTVNYHGSGSGHDSGDLVPPVGLSDSYGAPLPPDSYGPPKGVFDAPVLGDSYGVPPRQTHGTPAPKPVYGPPRHSRPLSPSFLKRTLLSPISNSYEFGTALAPSTAYGPPSTAAAPPTPPLIKYDGWKPMPGLVSQPPSGSYGAPLTGPSVSFSSPASAKPSLSFSSSSFGSSGSYSPPPKPSYGLPLQLSTGYGAPTAIKPPSFHGPPKPPSISYGSPKPPSISYGPPKPPSISYGPPKPPSISYGPPKPPSISYGPPKPPSISYGPPKPPSISYGPPKPPSSLYGPPKPPSSLYGAPKPPSSTYGSPKPPSISYGPPKPPSISYGPPKPPSISYGRPKPPSSSYGPPKPPSSFYGPPVSGPSISFKPPSTAYGSPKPPSSSYGPPVSGPSISIKPPSSAYGPPKPPSSSYGPPVSGPSISIKPPSSAYGPPKPPSSSYGPPVSGPSISIKPPSSAYGPPKPPSSSYGPPVSGPSISINPPSTEYGLPGSGSSVSFKSPAAEYGPPIGPSSFGQSISFSKPSSTAFVPPSTSYGTPHSVVSFTLPQPSTSYGGPPSPSPSPDVSYGAPQITGCCGTAPPDLALQAPVHVSSQLPAVYGTPLLPVANADFSTQGLPQPKHPVKFRPPVPVGLISSLGSKWGDANAWGGNVHAHKYHGDTYIPPAVPDPDPGTQVHKETDLVIPPPSAPSTNYDESIPVQGKHGSYTLQIQAAGGNPPDPVPHHEVLSNGLLQNILAAIETPSSSLNFQATNDNHVSFDQQSVNLPYDLQHSASSNVLAYEKPDNDTVLVPRPFSFGNDSVTTEAATGYLSNSALYFDARSSADDVVLVQIPNNSTEPNEGLVSYTVDNAQNRNSNQPGVPS